jgi:hypothetical protein
MAFTLAEIRSGIRNVTGRPLNSSDLTDTQIDNFINKFYLYVLPDESKPFKLLVDYKFNTLMNQVTYAFDLNTYLSLEPSFFCNGNILLYYQDRSLWIRDYQYQYNQSTAATGGGVLTSFNGVTTPPIIPGTVVFTDNVEVFSDDGNGILTGSLGGSGTFNYNTGVWAITFNTAPALGQNIILTTAPLNNGRPRAMYYDGQGTIQFSPIPDQSYTIEGSAYIQPTAFIEGGAGSQTPLNDYFGYVMIYGTSLEIFRQFGQLDQKAQYQPEYDYYLDLFIGRSTQQYSNQRAIPKW